MSTRFDDPQYLADWVSGGFFPQIHDKMTFAAKFLKKGNLLDLCCSYGLLGTRLKKLYPELFPKVIGVDGDPKVVTAAKAAGMAIDSLTHLRVERSTLPQLLDLIKANNITSIVARRAFPELFSEDLDFGTMTAKALAEAGVEEILIEGRVYSARSTNTLSKLENETALFGEYYGANNPSGLANIALLTRRIG